MLSPFFTRGGDVSPPGPEEGNMNTTGSIHPATIDRITNQSIPLDWREMITEADWREVRSYEATEAWEDGLPVQVIAWMDYTIPGTLTDATYTEVWWGAPTERATAEWSYAWGGSNWTPVRRQIGHPAGMTLHQIAGTAWRPDVRYALAARDGKDIDEVIASIRAFLATLDEEDVDD